MHTSVFDDCQVQLRRHIGLELRHQSLHLLLVNVPDLCKTSMRCTFVANAFTFTTVWLLINEKRKQRKNLCNKKPVACEKQKKQPVQKEKEAAPVHGLALCPLLSGQME
jgi:hypothetical protein